MAKYKEAAPILQDRSMLELEAVWYIEKKGWKMTYILPNVGPTLYEKEIEGKRVTLTADHALEYEAKVEEPRGYEY